MSRAVAISASALQAVRETLGAAASTADADLVPGLELLPYAEDAVVPLPASVERVEGIVRWWNSARFGDVLAASPRCEWLHTASAGVDYVRTPVVLSRVAQGGLTVTNSAAAFEGVIAEFVMGWLLTVTRRYDRLLDNQRARRWEGFAQDELAGKILGIIGAGTLARGLARRARAFEMRVLCQRRTLPRAGDADPDFDETVAGAEGLARVLRESDFVVVAAALTDETRRMIGAAQLALMKPTAWLVNVARGALVDEAALIDVLQRRAIGGACLDVFEVEPLPPTSPLWDLDNVYLAPHYSHGGTRQLKQRQADLLVANLRAFARREQPQTPVDLMRGY